MFNAIAMKINGNMKMTGNCSNATMLHTMLRSASAAAMSIGAKRNCIFRCFTFFTIPTLNTLLPPLSADSQGLGDLLRYGNGDGELVFIDMSWDGTGDGVEASGSGAILYLCFMKFLSIDFLFVMKIPRGSSAGMGLGVFSSGSGVFLLLFPAVGKGILACGSGELFLLLLFSKATRDSGSGRP